VKPSAVASSETYVVSLPHRESGRGSAQGSGWREIVIQRFTHRQKRCVGRGTGAVKATGSYEESLSTEGIPDHTRRRPSRDGDSGGLGRLHIFRPVRTNQKKDVRPACSSCEGGRGAKMKRRACDRGVRGSIASAPWEENAHARDFTVARPGARGLAFDDDPPKRSSDGVNHPVPRSYRAEPKTPWGVPAAKAARASREQARCGCTQVVWVADIGSTHRVSSPPGGRKACW
jgi:hypothetical protein